MNKILTYLIIGAVALGATSCKKYLDINDNTNVPVTATPGLVLPGAITGTASLVNSYSYEMRWPAGYFANVYGVGGYGATVSLNYTPVNFGGLWSSAYNIANDYQYVITNTDGQANLIYSNAIARIMKSFVFSKLVDQYGDVPYSEALKGASNVTPKYDQGEVIYQDLVAQLNTAIESITAGQASEATTGILPNEDPMFGGDMDQWKQFANTLKLKLLVKMATVSELRSFTTPQFAAFDNTIGVITENAMINPGYLKQGGRLSPIYSTYAANENDQRTQSQAIPTTWILTFYNGNKLSDQVRGRATFRGFPSVSTNQLGNENTTSSQVPPANFTSWYTGSVFGITTTSESVVGITKGPAQDQPVMLAAEAQFLLAEAYARGYLSGNDGEAFSAGIKASFDFILTDQTGALTNTRTDTLVTRYIAANASAPKPYLVNYNLATDLNERIEAIITQKYIALNLLGADEAFNEYRRTGYPAVSGSSPTTTFASTQSVSTRADKMLSRIPYPTAEYTLNTANVPKDVNIFQDRIFWDVE